MKRDTSIERSMRRRLALLVLLHGAPRSYSNIVAALDQQVLFLYDREEDPEVIARLQLYQFRHDLQALRSMSYEITYDRASQLYSWTNSPFGLALDGTQLNTLAMLLNTFAASTIPHAKELQRLLAALVERLPIEQQKKLAGQRQPFQIDLRETSDYRQGDAHNLHMIELAIQRKQQLEFRYCSPRKGQERRHVIESRPLVFKDGHVYLSGWNLEYEKELRYRLDYIVSGSAKSVPITSAPGRPPPRTYQLRYQLTSTIARHQVSEHFPQQRIERHDDGSATVTADITDLFEARRILLGYGENCIVLGPPELIEQFRIVAIDYGCKYLTAPM